MVKPRVSVIDYGAGNIASVINMINHVGGEAETVSDPTRLADAEKLLLPGVGAFDHGMRCLHEGGWNEALDAVVLENRTPIIGICLGMQLMCRSSQEGQEEGLGWIDADVLRFEFGDDSSALKIPHMGWNTVQVIRPGLIDLEQAVEWRFYFVHSYYVSCANQQDVFLKCTYGTEFTAGFHRDNIWGVQFHPEKSHKFGMAVFKRFLEV